MERKKTFHTHNLYLVFKLQENPFTVLKCVISLMTLDRKNFNSRIFHTLPYCFYKNKNRKKENCLQRVTRKILFLLNISYNP